MELRKLTIQGHMVTGDYVSATVVGADDKELLTIFVEIRSGWFAKGKVVERGRIDSGAWWKRIGLNLNTHRTKRFRRRLIAMLKGPLERAREQHDTYEKLPPNDWPIVSWTYNRETEEMIFTEDAPC